MRAASRLAFAAASRAFSAASLAFSAAWRAALGFAGGVSPARVVAAAGRSVSEVTAGRVVAAAGVRDEARRGAVSRSGPARSARSPATAESLAVAMFSMLKRELTKNTKRQLGALLAKDAFHAIRKRMDPEVHGGAPMLGFNSLVFKAHASARERAVASAIRVTANAIQHQINQIIARDIAAANEKLAEISAKP